MKRQFKTHKIDTDLYIATGLSGEHAYGKTRSATLKILKHDLRATKPESPKQNED